MFGTFRRPVGAAADVRELEYVSAIHQTGIPHVREEGTVSAADVQLFLKSRYGVDTSDDEAIDIVRGLGGVVCPSLSDEALVEEQVTSNGPESENILFCEAETRENGSGSARVNGPNNPNPMQPRSSSETTGGDGPSVLGDGASTSRNDKIPDISDWMAMKKKIHDIQKHNANAQIMNLRQNWNFASAAPQKRVTVKTSLFTKGIKMDRKAPTNPLEKASIDIVQMTGILLIPTLLRAKKERFKMRHMEGHRERLLHVTIFRRILNFFLFPFTNYKKKKAAKIKADLDALIPPEHLLEDALRILLAPITMRQEEAAGRDKDTPEIVAGSKTDCLPGIKRATVSAELVRDLLEMNGEYDAASDDNLVKKMVDAAGGHGVPLDESTFSKALTSDVLKWNVGTEDFISTSFFDVYGFSVQDASHYAASPHPSADILVAAMDNTSRKTASSSEVHILTDAEIAFGVDKSNPMNANQGRQEDNSKISLQETQDSVSCGTVPKIVPTAPYVDYAADTYRSKSFIMYLFVFYIFASVLGMTALSATGFTSIDCDNSNFACKLLDTIWAWFSVAIVLSLGGLLITLPVSMGNDAYTKSARRVIGSLLLLVVYSVGSYLAMWYWERGIPHAEDGVKTEIEKRFELYYISPVQYAFLIFAGLAAFKLFENLLAVSLSQAFIRRFSLLRTVLLPANILSTTDIKLSATRKLNRMLEHAFNLHRLSNSRLKANNGANDDIMLNFVLHGEAFEKCGGLFWTWKRLLNRELFYKEGVWIHSRLATGQIGQVMTLIVLAVAWAFGTRELVEYSEQNRKNLIEQGGFAADFALRYVPESWMIYASFIPAGVVSWIVGIVLILITLPSSVGTILRLRCGNISTLHDPELFKYRLSADTIFYNVGNMVYALVGSATLFFILFAGALFLLYWPPTHDFMILVVAWGIGLQITVALKMILMKIFRSQYSRALYRRKPRPGNISALAMECWHIGLGGGVMLGRLTQFLLAAAFWIGRIDQPFLSENVSLLGYRFDNVPLHFMKELLVHDAHRHPFMERLSAMYLMRLRYRGHFSSDAGAAWRNLFVLALMPWLMKFRQGSSVPHNDNDLENLNENLDDMLSIRVKDRTKYASDPKEDKGATEHFFGAVTDNVGVVVGQARKQGKHIAPKVKTLGKGFMHTGNSTTEEFQDEGL